MQNVGPDDSHSVALGVPFLTPSVLVIALRCSIGGGAAAGRAQLDSVFKAEHCILWVKREGVGDEGLVGGACRQVVHRSPLPPRLSFLQVGFLSVEGDVGGGAALLIVLHAGVHTPPLTHHPFWLMRLLSPLYVQLSLESSAGQILTF